MADQSKRARVYEMYLEDYSIQEIAKKTGVYAFKVSEYFVEFRLHQERIDNISIPNRISQAHSMWDDLEKHMNSRVIDPIEWERKYITKRDNYAKFLVK